MELLTTRYSDKIVGVLGCFDRIILKGILPSICYGDAMARHLTKQNILLKDYMKYVAPLREELRLKCRTISC